MFQGGGNCLKHLKREWNKKDERGNKDFKEERGGGRGQAGLRGGCLKIEKCNPLTSYDNKIHFRIITNFYISMYSVYY